MRGEKPVLLLKNGFFLLHCLKMCIIHVAIGGSAKRDCRKSFVRKAVP